MRGVEDLEMISTTRAVGQVAGGLDLLCSNVNVQP